MSEPGPFEQLDFLYTPSSDVAADMRYFTETLGGRAVFAIQDGTVHAAMIELTDGAPRIVLTDHLEGERPILIYRVARLKDALRQLERRGWVPEDTFEIPQGPCCSFTTPGGHRIALYQLTRPKVAENFEGRFDF